VDGGAADAHRVMRSEGGRALGWNAGVVFGLAAVFVLLCAAHVLINDSSFVWPGAATISTRAFAAAVALVGASLALVRYVARRSPLTLVMASALGASGLFMLVRTIITLIGYADPSFTFLFEISVRTAWAQNTVFAVIVLAGVALVPERIGHGAGSGHVVGSRRRAVFLVLAAVATIAGALGAWHPSFPGGVDAGAMVARPDYGLPAALHLIVLVALWQRGDVLAAAEGRWLAFAMYVSFLNQVLVLPFWPTTAAAAASALGSAMNVVVYSIICAGLLVGTHAAERREAQAREAARRLEEERSRVQSALARQAARLQKANEELAQYASVASHDLQEPLRMITSYLQLIERRYDRLLDDDGRDFIRYAVDGAARMKRLTTDLLNYSRVSGAPLEAAEVSLEDVLRVAVRNLEVAIAESGAEVTFDALPTVSADFTQMVQVFQNLVGNSIKFRRTDTTPQVHVSATLEGPDWVIVVRDNGIGIDERFRDKVFAVFQRLKRDDTVPGTGIGLALCRKIVERHGGSIAFESTPGVGSAFRFTLPVAGAPAPDMDEDADDPAVSHQVATLVDRARELI
jgi:signal transduction histidine kinase